jgi:two-component system sensor histidine kinase/response regulator
MKKAMILIVDDDPTNAEILSEYLKKANFETILVGSGSQAIEQCKHLPPDVILLDVMMPDMDGFETCFQLKQHETTRDIPVIFTTALSDTISKVKGFEVGGVDYITKPFHPDEVLARVNTHLMIRWQQQQLQQQTEQLKALNAEKDTFLSMIAHDLRSPFSSLRLLIGIAAENVEGSGQDELENLITLLKKSSENLYTLLENLLAWSRIQQGLMKYRPQSLDMRAVILQNITLLEPHARQKQITLNNSIDEGTIVYADYHMVDAVVRNLISNALKFTYPGGHICISATFDEHSATISVADTGIGIAREHLSKLFRIDTVYRRKGTAREPGTGLGLILCKEFIEKNKGTIWAESDIDKGSTFRFSLPIPPSE